MHSKKDSEQQSSQQRLCRSERVNDIFRMLKRKKQKPQKNSPTPEALSQEAVQN